MATLQRQPSGPISLLLSRHLIGRSRLAALRLDDPTVSGEHAVMRWTGVEWELHDLGSRNGTSVDGRALVTGERTVLARGAVVTFGNGAESWKLIDDSPPSVLALPADGGTATAARNDLLALPNDDDPRAVIYRDAAGDWVLERNGEQNLIRDRQTVQLGAQSFLIRVPDLIEPTWERKADELHLRTLTLRFEVSRDEEYVRIEAISGERRVDLGARAHHAVLLMLARRRLADRSADGGGIPKSAEGWVYQDDLAKMLAMDEAHLNVAVFRCRRQLGEIGVLGAADVVERRRPTRELRLGVAQVEIVRV
ncbi:MAG: FHA domain-containing protein [Kofleriaceae bacterium]